MSRAGPTYNHDAIKAVAREMLPTGATLGQVALEIGCSPETVSRVVNADPAIRALRPVKDHACATTLARYNLKFGSLGNTLRKQDAKIRDWIFLSAANLGVDVAEFVTSCAIDAYYDENTPKEE